MEEVTLNCPDCGESFVIPVPDRKLEICTCDRCGQELSAWDNCCVICSFSDTFHDAV